MKVCMVTYSFYESDNRVMRYAETLAARGDEVDVVSLRHPGQEELGQLHGVNIFRLQARTRDERGKLSYLLRIMNFFVRAFFFLASAHLRKRYDLVHVHSVPDFLVFTALVPKIGGARIILDIHDIVPELYAGKFHATQGGLLFRALLLMERSSAAFAHHVIIANHLWREKITSRSVRADKCTALMNYPDQTIFTKSERNRSDNKFIILYPGTLQHHQGLDIVIKAMGLIKTTLPIAELHIYGEGDAKDNLVDLAHKLHLEDRVLFHRPLPIREVARVIAQADLGVVAKRADSFGNEAQSTKILEFMSAGVPLVVSNTKIDSHYYDDSLVEFFRSGDAHDLARAILHLAEDKELRAARIATASQFAERNSWAHAKHIYLEIVDRLCQKIPARSELSQTLIGS